MFNPLNNKMVLQTIMNKVETELNNALIFRKKQFNNNDLYFWIEINPLSNKPKISLRKPDSEIIVEMAAADLIKDEHVKKQLDKIPAFIKSLINIDKIILKVESILTEKLQVNQYLKITEGKFKAKIDLYKNESGVIEKIDVYQFFIN